MTKFQKVIKYIAIALAVFLIFQILSAVTWGLRIIGGIHGVTHSDLTENMKSYVVENDIRELEIELGAASLEIKPGDELAIETNSQKILCKERSDTLEIKEKSHNWWRANEVGKVIVYIPEENILGKVNIEAGVGDIQIEGVELSNMSLEMGVGTLNLEAKLSGKHEFDMGVGDANLILIGSADEYTVGAEKGIGTVIIAGQKMQKNARIGNGTNLVDIDGGIGDITIDFKEAEKPEVLIPAPENITANEWAHYSPSIGESNVIRFGADNTYSYYCECGEPVGDSDVYETYTYDESTQTITIYGDEDTPAKEILILGQDKDRILLYIDEKVTEFLVYGDEYYPIKVYSECADYFEGSSSDEVILKKEGNVLTTAPTYYDGDVAEHRAMAREVKLADSVKYEYIEVYTTEKDGESNTTWEHRELTEEDFEVSLDGSSAEGFIWYNEAMEVTKIVLYGELIVME